MTSWEEFSAKGGAASQAKRTAGMTPEQKSQFYRDMVNKRWARKHAQEPDSEAESAEVPEGIKAGSAA